MLIVKTFLTLGNEFEYVHKCNFKIKNIETEKDNVTGTISHH